MRQDLLPDIKFILLPKGLEESDLFTYLDQKHSNLVYLRCKYKNDAEWEYMIEACELGILGDVTWLNDWWEGQEDVEYLGTTIIEEVI